MPHQILRHLIKVSTLGALLILAPLASADERPLNLRIVQSGHSLTDGIMDPLRRIIRAEGVRGAMIDNSSIPGSGMGYRWDHATPSYRIDARYKMARYETLVLTERAPLSGTIPWHDSNGDALRWFNHAWSVGNDGKGANTIFYATWVNTNSGPNFENPYNDPDGHITFRERLPREMAHWDDILEYVNANRPAGSPAMRMIPGPRLMAAIYDEIAAGRAPGMTNISDLFEDTIHLITLGGYYIALAHFAVIYERDPRGLQNIDGVTPQQAVWMQDLVWKVLSDDQAAS